MYGLRLPKPEPCAEAACHIIHNNVQRYRREGGCELETRAHAAVACACELMLARPAPYTDDIFIRNKNCRRVYYVRHIL